MSPLTPPPADVHPASAEYSQVVELPAANWSLPDSGPLHPAALIGRHSSASGSSLRTASLRAGRVSYVVRPGDTLIAIAQRHGMSLSRLLRYNGLKHKSVIKPGQTLAVPGQGKARTQAKAQRLGTNIATLGTITVQKGDSIETIAQRYGATQASILKANHLTTESIIRAGQKLRVPGVQAVQTGPAPSSGPGWAAHANRRYLRSTAVPTRGQIRRMIVQTSRRHGVNPKLALAIGWQESGWNQRVVSHANAVGVMQCLPSTADWVSGIVGQQLNVLQTQDAITCGVALIRSLQRSADNEEEVIAGYYQGLQSVRDNGMYDDTKAYIRSVQALKSRM